MWMKSFRNPRIVAIATTLLPLLLFAAAPHVARAQEPAAPPAPAAAPEKEKIPEEFIKMSAAHRALTSFNGEIELRNGWATEKIQAVTLAFRRPDRLRAVIVNREQEGDDKPRDVGEAQKVFVDGKNVYVYQRNRWRKTPFKPGDDLFAAYAAIVENTWASDLFTNPGLARDAAFDLERVSASGGEEKGENGEARYTLGGTGLNDDASMEYKTEYAWGKPDWLLRSRRVVGQPNNPMHDSDGYSSTVYYTNVRANPDLPDSLFNPPAAALKAPQKPVKPTKPVKPAPRRPRRKR